MIVVTTTFDYVLKYVCEMTALFSFEASSNNDYYAGQQRGGRGQNAQGPGDDKEPGDVKGVRAGPAIL